MAVSIESVLLITKFESATVVKRKLQWDFGKNTLNEHGSRTGFERLFETESVKDRSQCGRPTGINQEKVDEVK